MHNTEINISETFHIQFREITRTEMSCHRAISILIKMFFFYIFDPHVALSSVPLSAADTQGSSSVSQQAGGEIQQDNQEKGK